MSNFPFTHFASPWAFLLLIPAFLLLILELASRPHGSLSISTGETLRHIGRGRKLWLRHAPAVLRAAGLALLIAALARPLQGVVPRIDRHNVLDIMLCLDVSGSMQAMDFVIEGRRRDRLFVAKDAVRNFVQNRKERRTDRLGVDRLGLVLYAGFAWTVSPLTIDYEVLLHEVDRAYIDTQDPRKNGTAIGSAIGLAVSRLRNSAAASRVIVLLTDGINNRGELDPLTAANLANEYGIRVYTIGMGNPEGSFVPAQGLLFGHGGGQRVEGIDEESLRQIADATGGRYYLATDATALERAYAEISRLERTEIEVGDYYEYKEGFPPFAVLGGLLVLAALVSKRAWFEAIP